MRNLRKIAAVVLAISLVLTSMTAVFADDSATIANSDKAVTLKDLGLYSGQDANDPKVGLEDALTTQDSLIFLAKLFGYYETATKLSADEIAAGLAKFDDVASISDYAKNVVAYSAANGILSGSTQNGKFFVGSTVTVTAARFATFMLKQMGYTVADYKVSVAKLAEIKGSRVDATITGDLTRDDAVGIMYGALTADKPSGKTVIADIIGDDAALKAKAEKAGLITSVADDSGSNDKTDNTGSNVKTGDTGSTVKRLSVVSVKALNTKQVIIQFNADMDKDSAQDEANYEIKSNGSVVTLTTDSAILVDSKAVVITIDEVGITAMKNSCNATVTVKKDIKPVSVTKMENDYTNDKVAVEDGLIPTVVKAEATGGASIKLTFSEPVYGGTTDGLAINLSNIKVVGGTYEYNVSNVKADNDACTVSFDVGTKLIEGPITVTVNNNGLGSTNVIQDYAGYKAFKSSTTFNYVKDTSVPVVTVKSAKAFEVVLNFPNSVKGSNIKLYHTAKGIEDYKAEATTTGYVDEITFTFSKDKPLPGGKVNLFLVNSTTSGEEIIDTYGIKVPDQTFTCDVAIDTTAPVVTGYELNKDESIKINFNEELDSDVATNPESYVVNKLYDDKEIPFSAVIDDSMKSVELKFSTKLDDNTEYQLLIRNYQDVYGNKNSSDYECTLTTGDYKNPEVKDNTENDPEDNQWCYAVAEKGRIFITYSEAMNEAQMLDKGNYQVSIDDGITYKDLGADDTITKVNDRKVQIYVKEFESKNDPTIRPYVKIAPIMDLAEKRLYGSVDAHTVSSIGPENVCIIEAQLGDKNHIVVVFNKSMDVSLFNSQDIALVNLTTPGSISISVDSMVIDPLKTKVLFILDKDLATDVTDAAGARIGITTIADPSSESESGTKLRPNFSIELKDKTAPEIVKWNHDNNVSTDDIAQAIAGGDLASPQVYNEDYTVPQDTTGTITITFSEDIDAYSLSLLSFKVTGFTVTDITAPAGTKTVVLTVKADSNNTSVKTTVTQINDIYDTADNAFAPGLTWVVMFADTSLN